jgi:hypothetical protein
MPIEAHEEVGRLLAVISVATIGRNGVHNRVDLVRHELDEWTQREYNHQQLSNERFFQIYYPSVPGAHRFKAQDRSKYLGDLARVKELLSQHYPDCAPLRGLLRKLEAASVSLSKWQAGGQEGRHCT